MLIRITSEIRKPIWGRSIPNVLGHRGDLWVLTSSCTFKLVNEITGCLYLVTEGYGMGDLKRSKKVLGSLG